MQPREKKLAIMLAGLLVLGGGWLLFGQLADAFSSRRARLKVVEGEIREKSGRVQRGEQATARLAEFEHRSLPSDVEQARTQYQNWLVALTDEAELSGVNIDANRGGMHLGIYHKLPFTIRARGTLEQATRFMHAFYSQNHLHMLRDVHLNPIEKSKELDLSFTIEALVLPGADRKETLIDEPSGRLKLADQKAYSEAIVARNLFAAYVPPPPPKPIVKTAPPPPPPPKPPAFDTSRFAVLTAILDVDEVPQAWLSVKTSGETLKLRPGDPIEIGAFKGHVVSIGVAEMEIEADGQRRTVMLGKPLTPASEK